MFADIGLPPCLWGIPFHCSISLTKTQIVLNLRWDLTSFVKYGKIVAIGKCTSDVSCATCQPATPDQFLRSLLIPNAIMACRRREGEDHW